ncbi:transmembrane protein 179-like [Plakobranchus ocellatus]|uniref:Transmembrane protein 179-like n=1 Tax=Plakobranchus ocellatus TaxID=259542 RepID=A0AAV4B2S9_9GAST|nr:transmembrane protein 179-like [Plakobranchus ocellatus]
MATYDIQVVVQASIYFVTVIFGFVVAVPLGLTVIEFDQHCVLYTKFKWVNASYATYELSNEMVCNFPVLTAVFCCILYCAAVGLYFLYAACRSNDPNVGFQMWVMPFLLANALILILMFIACCIMSVGIKTTCDSFLKGKDKGNKIENCADAATKFDWNAGKKTDYNYSNFYSYSKTSEVAGWMTFLIWLVQMAFGVLRYVRNRRQRSADMGYEDEDTQRKSSSGPSDLENFAAANPSA